MRLIDADRLLSDRMKSKYYHLPNGDTAIPIIDIERAPTVNRWISVKDRLPDIGEVLTVVRYNGQSKLNVQTGEWTGESWVSVWDEYIVANATKEVLYWMPLPSTEGLKDA